MILRGSKEEVSNDKTNSDGVMYHMLWDGLLDHGFDGSRETD